MNRNYHFAWLTLLAGLVLAPSTALAQDTQGTTALDTTPAVIYACYVPTTGVVYRIKEEGLRPTCLAETHVAFSWPAGGTAGEPGVVAPLVSLAAPIADNDGFAYIGTFGVGVIPVTGPGTRLMWYPKKAALRAGQVTTTEWDDGQIGLRSMALGFNTIASGNFATAFGSKSTASGVMSTATGRLTTASGFRSTAMGFRTTASGENATALGSDATASGENSTAMGKSTAASGENSTAMGKSTTASERNSTAMGQSTTASGPYSTAMGWSATASGAGSTAMGEFTTASGTMGATAMGSGTTASGDASTAMGSGTAASGEVSTALGLNTTASGRQSTAMGDATTAQALGSVVLGQFNVIAGDPATWLATDPLLVAGNGADAGNPSNALTLLKNGDLTAAGTIESEAGGFKFPDGSVQTSAATAVADHGGLAGLLDDDHTQYLLANGVRTSTGFAATGATGAIPVTGAGTRLMWYPGKAALRAGHVNGTQWDDVNVGTNSTAMGYFTTASGPQSTAMGHVTTASGGNSTAMGNSTTASGASSTAMGNQATASGVNSTAMGIGTTASGAVSTAMGEGTIASGDFSTAMGEITTAGGEASTAMGLRTVASGGNSTAMGESTIASAANSTAMGFRTTASGAFSTAIGRNTTANGTQSTAMGSYVSTNLGTGAFVYGDASTTSVMNAAGQNSFTVRAAGGTRFYSDAALTTGVQLFSGAGSWTTVSDRNLKENFQDHDGEDVLDAIATMPIQSWNYKAQDPSIRHMGPMAQDFHAAFGLGLDDKHINTVDIDGINLLAVQALETRTQQLRTENQQLTGRLTGLERDNQQLQAMVADLTTAVQQLEAAQAGRQQ